MGTETPGDGEVFVWVLYGYGTEGKGVDAARMYIFIHTLFLKSAE